MLISTLHNIRLHSLAFHKSLQRNLLIQVKDIQQQLLSKGTHHKAMALPSHLAIRRRIPKDKTTIGPSKHTRRAKLRRRHLFTLVTKPMELHRRPISNIRHILQQ